MTDKRIGLTLGGYRIVERIGQGGMATVYKAFQPSMERYVALKVIPEYHANDASFVQRFILEARTIARLEHKHILPVYDFGEENGLTYMAMRYLDTGTLQDVLLQGRPTLWESLQIVEQICEALDYAHRNGVVHRDVKPSNVMLDEEGNVYLTDFGLAKMLENSPKLTATGAVLGTPLYMAPEQSLGKPVDARADIYAVGVILYELVTGKPPFQADTPLAVALAHVHEELPPPKMLNPDLPDEIQLIILKAMAKDPADRYQTAREMAQAVATARQHLQREAEHPTLQLLTDQVRAQRAALSQETAVPAAVPPAPEDTRPGAKKYIWLGSGALLLLMLGIFLVTSRNYLAASGAMVPATAAPQLYDDFSDTRFDGRIDPTRWDVDADPACNLQQQNGELIMYSTGVDYVMDTCDLLVKHPLPEVPLDALETIQAAIRFDSGAYGQTAGESLMYNALLPDGSYWVALCGPEKQGNHLIASLWVARLDEAGDEMQTPFYAEIETPVQADRWYTYRMKLDATSGTVACWLDGELIGRTTLDELAELRQATFWRGLSAWWDPNTSATMRVDDFWLNP